MSKSKHKILMAIIIFSFAGIQVWGGYSTMRARKIYLSKINLTNKANTAEYEEGMWREGRMAELRDAKAALTNELSHLDMLMRKQLWSIEERERYFRLKWGIAVKHEKRETASAYAMFIVSRFDYPSAGKKFKE